MAGCQPDGPDSAAADAGYGGLETVQECNQVGFLLIVKAYAEAVVIELHHIALTGGRAIAKVGCAGGQPAENRPLDLSDVSPQSRH